MTEPFRAPEPSGEAAAAAWSAYERHTNTNWADGITAVVSAAYAVDLPAILRKEVELGVKALLTSYDHEGFNANVHAYTLARYGEPTLELCGNYDGTCKRPMGHEGNCGPGEPTPEKPLERVRAPKGFGLPLVVAPDCCHTAWTAGCASCAEVQSRSNDLLRSALDTFQRPEGAPEPRNTCVRCAWMQDGSLAGCERCGGSLLSASHHRCGDYITLAERAFLRELALKRYNDLSQVSSINVRDPLFIAAKALLSSESL